MCEAREVELTSDEIVANARGLTDDVRSQADTIAAGRRLPDDLVQSLREAGVFRMPMPLTWGGPEMTPRAQTEVVEILSAADPSAGWCVMIGSDAGYYSAFLGEDAGRELYPDLDIITAGWLVPAGRAERVDGGYVVSGRWSFGSCSLHADVIHGGCLVFEDGQMRTMASGLPEMRIVAAPASSWEVLDTWYTTGLAGSGSNDYEASQMFVPTERTFSLYEPPKRARPLYAFPGMFFSNMHGVALGLARRAIDEVCGIAESKVLMPEMIAMRDAPRVRSAIARAEMALGAARAYTYATLDDVWNELSATGSLSKGNRIALGLSRVNAFRTARDVAQLMLDTAGSQAIYATSPLDRLLRDAITVNQHIVAQERMLEILGGLELTAESPFPFV
jgi:alkylation response protein AidB-like acyl-CoA dehydrogenase